MQYCILRCGFSLIINFTTIFCITDRHRCMVSNPASGSEGPAFKSLLGDRLSQLRIIVAFLSPFLNYNTTVSFHIVSNSLVINYLAIRRYSRY